MADAAESSVRSASTAPASVPPIAGAPPVVTRTTNGRSVASSRPMGPTGEVRGPSTRIICALRPASRSTIAPPSSALIERSATSGCERSTSSITRRSGGLAQQRTPG
jgi:hypothetical protein